MVLMKKLLSVLLVTAVLLSVSLIPVTPVSAADGDLVYHESFESGSVLYQDTPLWAPMPGAYVQGAESISGYRSYKTGGLTANAWNFMVGSGDQLLWMDEAASYTVALKYKATGIYNFLIQVYENANHTEVAYINFDGNYGVNLDPGSTPFTYADMGSYKYVYFTFPASEFGAYNEYLKINAFAVQDGASVTIDDLMVFKGAGVPAQYLPQNETVAQKIYHTGFDASTDLQGSTIMWGGGSFITTNPINGGQSYKFTPAAGWIHIAGTEFSELSLQTNDTYTVALKYRATDVSNFVVNAICVPGYTATSYININPATGKSVDPGAVPHVAYAVGDYYYLYFSFQGSTAYNTYLEFHTNAVAGATLTIDDLAIYKGKNIPRHDFPGMEQVIKQSDFEVGFGDFVTSYDPITRPDSVDGHTAVLTKANSNVINGRQSVVAGFDNTFAANWATFVHAPLSNLPGGNTYVIKMRYKAVQETSSHFHILMDADSWENDVYIGFTGSGAMTWVGMSSYITAYKVENDTDGGKILTVGMFLPVGVNYFDLILGAEGGGYLAVDDIALYKGETAPAYAQAVPNLTNAAPVAEDIAFEIEPGGTYNGNFLVTDADDTVFDYTFTSDTNKGTLTITGNSFSYEGFIDSKGTEVINVTVTDHGATDTFTVTVTFSAPEILYGDATGDGFITVSDIIAIKRHIVGIESLEGVFLEAANVYTDDGDLININDIILVKKYVLGIIDTFEEE